MNKCGLQLAAYALAVEETLGLHVDCAQILVSTPEIDQNFLIHGDASEGVHNPGYVEALLDASIAALK